MLRVRPGREGATRCARGGRAPQTNGVDSVKMFTSEIFSRYFAGAFVEATRKSFVVANAMTRLSFPTAQ